MLSLPRFDHSARDTVFRGKLNFREASTEDELVSAIKEFHGKGLPAFIKPNNGGQGIGAMDFKDLSMGADEIRQRIRNAEADCRGKVGAQIGYPFTVMECWQGKDLEIPEGHPRHFANGWRAELGIYLIADITGPVPMFRAVPQLAKLAPPGELGTVTSRTGDASRDKDGLTHQDLTLPLCNEDSLALIGCEKSKMTELVQWSTGLAAHIFSNFDKYSGHVPPAGSPAIVR